MSILHFGIRIQDKESNRINKNTYLSAKPEYMRGWREEHYPRQILKASLNYDMNMKFFESLDKKEFDAYIAKRIKKFKMQECFDLNELAGVEGLYMLVLDDYKQVYIGISGDIKRRTQGHWRKQKSLERLIFGDVCNSVLSIDSFGPLDTTRIFYVKSDSTYLLEEKVVKAFDPIYTLNRTAGGIGSTDTYTDTKATASMAVVAHHRKRNLTQYIDIEQLRKALTDEDFRFYLHRYPELRKML